MLISVVQLCQQLGIVVFHWDGAEIATEVGNGKMINMQIGLATKGNLYSFDLAALEGHVCEVTEAGGYD